MQRDVTAGRTVLIALFDDHEGLVGAVEELRAYGFKEDQIGFAVHDRGRIVEGSAASEAETGRVEGAAAGATTGGIIGGLAGAGALLVPGVGPILAAGAVASALAGAALGAAAGGLLGALSDSGLLDQEARYYDEQFRSGRNLLTVRTDGRTRDAHDILLRHGAHDVRATNSGERVTGTEPARGEDAERYAGGVTDEEEDPIRLTKDRP